MNKISDQEMLKTFNCGVGFCLIIKPKNLEKVIKSFPKKLSTLYYWKNISRKKKCNDK